LRIAAGIGDLRGLTCLRPENGPFRPDRHPLKEFDANGNGGFVKETGMIAGTMDVAVNFAKFIG
jgi:hypothetical protein